MVSAALQEGYEEHQLDRRQFDEKVGTSV